MTNKQRAKIYRRAAEVITEGKWTLCCSAICASCDDLDLTPDRFWNGYTSTIVEKFPEMGLFQQPRTFWWDNGDDSSRILALLFAEQIALNP